MRQDSLICNRTLSWVTWLSHAWHTSVSVYRDLFMCDRTYTWHDAYVHAWRDLFVCDMTHSYVTWLIHACLTSISCCRDLFMCDVTWRIHDKTHMYTCDVTYSYATWLIHMWHDSFMRGIPQSLVTGLFSCVPLHIRDMTHLYVTWRIYVWYDSFIWVTWLIHAWYTSATSYRALLMCDVTHTWQDAHVHVCRDSFICHKTHSCMAWRIHVWCDSFIWMTWLVVMRHDAYMAWYIHSWYDSFICDMTHAYWSKETPPPRGGFLFTMFPHQEPCVRETPSKNLVQILRGGSLLHTVLDEGTW